MSFVPNFSCREFYLVDIRDYGSVCFPLLYYTYFPAGFLTSVYMSKGLSKFSWGIPLSVLNMSLYFVDLWWPILLEHLKDISYGVTVKMLEFVVSWNSGVSGVPCIVWSLSVAGAEGILLKVSLNRPFVELFCVSSCRSGFVGDFYNFFAIGGTASLLWCELSFKFFVANSGSKSITVTGLYSFFTDLGISKCLLFKMCPELNWRNF